ncbi:hypothetical protein [Micromonospora sp. NPDC085948]|uniref:hypothetical protein n=1 Tax=Micromonospora sp. NPDC085948 TaxID=3155293 RepID=UPI0034454F34
MPTSASDIRHAHAGVAPVAMRRRATTDTTSAAKGSAATVVWTTPVNVPIQ